MIRVGIAEDQMLVRQGLCSMLSLADDLEIVFQAEDGEQAVRLLAEQQPDVLLLDYRMPRLDGLGVLRTLAGQRLLPPTLILTTFDDSDLVFEGVAAGARGYLLKDVPLTELLQAIRTLAAGGRWLQPTVTAHIRRCLDPGSAVTAPASPAALTPREQEVLRLLAGGFNNREIGQLLATTEGTVKSYVSNIFSKLDVRDRTRAVLRALEWELL